MFGLATALLLPLMSDPLSISVSDLLHLFNEERSKPIKALLEKYKASFSPDEMARQLQSKSGPVYEAAQKYWNEFGRININVEVVTTIGLSYFYFGIDAETLISFEMKNSYRKPWVSSYSELAENIETSTHVDSAVEDDHTKLVFQIKTYKQKYLEHTNAAFLEWLETSVLRGYGDMSGTVLVVLIQPQFAYSKTDLNFDELTPELTRRRDKISFDGIVVSYTDASPETATLQEIYPNNRRFDIPLTTMLAKFRGE